MKPETSKNSGRLMEVLPIFTAAYIIGLSLAGFLPPWSAWLSLTIALGGAAIALLVPIAGAEAWLPLLVCAIACGTFGGTIRDNYSDSKLLSLSPLNGAHAALTGVCSGEFKPLSRGSISCTFERVCIEAASQSINLSDKVLVVAKTSTLLPFPGQCYTAVGTISISESRKNPIKFRASKLLPASSPEPLTLTIGRVRHIVRSCISDFFPDRHQAFMEGLLLGDTSALSSEDRQLFKNTGISHLLAVSGQHLLVFAFVLTAILAWSGTPPLSRALLTVMILAFYAMLTAGAPSVWRAIIMYSLVAASLLFEADPGPIRPLAAAALILLLYDPNWLRHAGFQLSFLAVLGIAMGRAPLEWCLIKLKLPPMLSRYLAVSTAATAATMPAAAWHFGTIPLSAFIVNPLVVWSFDFILPVGLLTVIASTISSKIALLLAAGLSLALDAFIYIVKIGAAMPLATIEAGALPATTIILTYAAFLALISWWYRSSNPIQAAQAQTHPNALRPPETKIELTSKPTAKQTPPQPINPLKTDSLLDTLELHLAVFPKRTLKQSPQNPAGALFPVQRLTTESQNLYYRIDDLTQEILQNQPDRLIEAQIYCMALLSNELLTRIAPKLEPPPTTADVKIRRTVKNRHLALAMAAEAFFNSPLPARKIRPDLGQLIQQAYCLHQEGCSLLERFIRARAEESICAHLEFRKKVFDWCQALTEALHP